MERDAFDPGGAASNFGAAFAGAAKNALGTIAKSPIGQGFAAAGASGGGFMPATEAFVGMSTRRARRRLRPAQRSWAQS